MADATMTLTWLRAFIQTRRTDRAAILVEYALLIALIVVACLGAVQAFGAKVPAHAFSSVTQTL